MKQLFTLVLCATLFAGMANAKIIYVAASGNNSDGLTWANGYTTIAAANAVAVTNDDVYIKAGTYSLPASTGSALLTEKNVSYYGGFAGLSEAETPSTRVLSDLDGNGIVESWEFTNASILNFTLTNNSVGVNIASNTASHAFDGFKIQGTHECGTFGTPLTTTLAQNIVLINNFCLFQNNTISDCTVTSFVNSTTGFGVNQGSVLRMSGYASTVDNCLFENDICTITSGAAQTDVQQSPFIHIIGSWDGQNIFSNNIIRKNQVTVDFSALTAASPQYYNIRGLLISTIPNRSTLKNVIKNVIIHNNDATFNPKTGTTTQLPTAGLVFSYSVASIAMDSIINCTIANNKSTRIGFALFPKFQNATQPYHVVANNVSYNNTNLLANGSTTLQNISASALSTATAPAALMASNIANGTWTAFNAVNTGNVVGNLNDLASINADATKGAFFSAPTSIIGYSTDASVVTSRWTIGASSYLKGKAIATNSLTDKAGHTFDVTTPAVGAYEYALYTVTANAADANGSVSGGTTVDYGSPITLTATPTFGYKFDTWKNGTTVVSNSAIYTFFPTDNITLSANFVVDNTTALQTLVVNTLVIINGRSLKFNLLGTVEVYNSLGILVVTRKGNEPSLELNNAGIYIVKAQTPQGVKIQKILVK